MLLNLNYLACFYYNIRKPSQYDLNLSADREKARKNFQNTTYIDVEILREAQQLYREYLEKDFTELNEFVRSNKSKDNSG